MLPLGRRQFSAHWCPPCRGARHARAPRLRREGTGSRRAQRGDGDATRAARFRPGPTAAAKARELQLASDKRSPPGFRTIAVLSEEWAGRSLHVKLFGAPDDPYFPEEAEKFARELRGIALGFGPAGSHTIRASLLAETSLMGRFNHRNVFRFDGLLWRGSASLRRRCGLASPQCRRRRISGFVC